MAERQSHGGGADGVRVWGATDRPHGVDTRLLIWLAPSFPVGAFAYSHGLELAADRGWVRDRAGLEAWRGDLIEVGSVRSDLVLVAAAWRASVAGDAATLAECSELGLALQPSAERRVETTTQGDAFLATIEAAWPCDGLDLVRSATGGAIAYPVAVGAVAARHGIAAADVLAGYCVATVTSLVSAAIRLSLVGQTDGQRVVAALLPQIQAAAAAAEGQSLDDVGGVTLRSDLASLAHETQYSRLFRS